MDARILILEDSRLDVELMVTRLEHADLTFEYRHVDNRDQFENSLISYQPNLILSDFKLPDINGFEAIEINKNRERSVPLIIISGAIGEENAADVIKAGAVDYVSKDHPERLPLVVVRALEEREQQRKRHEAEAQVHLMERRLGYLFDNSLDGILFVRGNGEILAANPAASQMLGYGSAEITSMTRWDLLDESDPRTRKAVKVREKEGYFRGELNMIRNDGSRLPVEISINFEEENRELEGGYAIFRDISSRLEYERALDREKELQRLLKEIGLMINDEIDTDSALQYCTELICDFLEWPVGHIYLVNEISEELVSSDIWHCQGDESFKAFIKDTTQRSFKLNEGLLGEVYKMKEPRFVPDLSDQNNFKRTLVCQKNKLKTGLIFPLIAWGAPVAIMEHYTDREEFFHPDMVNHVRIIGDHIGRLLERKLAQELIEEKEKMFRLLAENSTDLISRHDPDGNFLYASPASKSLLGYKPDELIGTNLRDYVHPDDLHRLQNTEAAERDRAFNRLLQGGYRFRRKSGGYQWVETLSKPVEQDDTGYLLEYQASTRDISGRKEYEEMMRKEKIFNEQVVNSLPELFFIINENLKIEHVNENFRETLGYDNDEVFSFLSPSEFVAEDERGRFIETLKNAFVDGAFEIEVPLRTRDGESLPYILSGNRMILQDRKLLLGTGVDISKRIETEKKLLRQQQLLQSMMDQSEAVVYVKAKDGTFRFVNRAFLNLFGLSERAVVGQKDVDIMEERYVDPMRSSDLKALETGTPVEIEEKLEANGKFKVFLSTKVPLENVDGFENCVCGISTDITERKKIEENMREALEEKRILLMEIHHRVKNNLAVISSMMQLQAYQTDNEEVMQELTNSQSRIKSMAIVHELLYESNSFSRLNFKENITKIIRHIDKSIKTGTRIELELDLDAVELNVNQAIPCALILDELVINIYKYAFEGLERGVISLSLRERDGFVRLELRDNGIGLPNDFSIEDSATLGLKLVNVLTQQLDAELEYGSDESGSYFIIVFEKKEVSGIGSAIVD